MRSHKLFIAACIAISLSYSVSAEKRPRDSSDADRQERISSRFDGDINSARQSNVVSSQKDIPLNREAAVGDSISASHAQRHPKAIRASEDGLVTDGALSDEKTVVDAQINNVIDQTPSKAAESPLGSGSDVPSAASALVSSIRREGDSHAEHVATEDAEVVPQPSWDDPAAEDGHGEHDALFCRVCGHQLFAAEDHLSDLRFPGRRDGLAAGAPGQLSALRVRYLHAPSLGSNGTVHELEALPVVRAPQHMMVDRSQRDSRSRGSLDSTERAAASGTVSAGSASAASPSAAAAGAAPASSTSQLQSRWPVVDMAAFDVGSGITVGKPYAPSSLPPSGAAAAGTSGAGKAHAAVAEMLPGYAVRPVTCQQCGSTVGHHFTRRSPAGKGSGSSGSDGSGTAHAQAARAAAGAATVADSAARSRAAGGSSAALTPTPYPAPSTAPSYATPPTQYRVRTYKEGEEDAALSVLEGRCLSFSTGGWWRFMLCHKSRVRQYHRIEATGVDEPDWSLGTFVGGRKAERIGSPDAAPAADSPAAGANTDFATQIHTDPGTGAVIPTGASGAVAHAVQGAGRIYFTSHFFRGGQRCDENGQQRATEVQFFCCPAAVQHGSYILSVEEPALCRYTMRVCVDTLCVAVQRPSPSPTAEPPAVPVPPADGSAVAGAQGDAEEEAAQVHSDSSAASSAGASGTVDNSEAVSSVARDVSSEDNNDEDESLPSTFILAFLRALMGDRSDAYRALTGGAPMSGISPVRFGG